MLMPTKTPMAALMEIQIKLLHIRVVAVVVAVLSHVQALFLHILTMRVSRVILELGLSLQVTISIGYVILLGHLRVIQVLLQQTMVPRISMWRPPEMVVAIQISVRY